MEKDLGLNLTKQEAIALADFIHTYLFDIIRKDTNIDNFMWLRGIIGIYEKLAVFAEFTEN